MSARVERPIPRRGLSRIEAAAYIGVSASKFDELRADGRIGPAKLIDGRKVWDIHVLDADFDRLPEDGVNQEAEAWDVAV